MIERAGLKKNVLRIRYAVKRFLRSLRVKAARSCNHAIEFGARCRGWQWRLPGAMGVAGQRVGLLPGA
jgi:hypothetical protein